MHYFNLTYFSGHHDVYVCLLLNPKKQGLLFTFGCLNTFHVKHLFFLALNCFGVESDTLAFLIDCLDTIH